MTNTLACLSLWATQAPAIEYRFTDLGAIVSGFGSPQIRGSHGESINEFGEVVGWSTTKGGEVQANLYRGSWNDLGTMPDVDLGGYVIEFDQDSWDQAYGVNNDGHVTGTAYAEFSVPRAFLYDGTMMHDVGAIGGAISEGRDINSAGHVVGWSTIVVGMPDVVHAFLYDGTIHDLGTLGGSSSRGYGINDLGQTTGSSQIAGDTAEHAFLHDGTMMYDLGTLGGTNSYGQDINIHGQVTGYSELASPSTTQHAFFYDGVVMHNLGALGGTYSAGFGVNADGHVVGEFGELIELGDSVVPVGTRAFFYTNETGMVDLNSITDLPPGWTLRTARDINDAGQITGTARVSGSFPHAFVLTPVPEPGTAVFVALAIVIPLPIRVRTWGRLVVLQRIDFGYWVAELAKVQHSPLRRYAKKTC